MSKSKKTLGPYELAVFVASDMLAELKRIQNDLYEHENADAELMSRLSNIITRVETSNVLPKAFSKGARR